MQLKFLSSIHMPEEEAFLAAVGRVAIRHVHLDFVLRMTVKTLAGLTPAEGRLATASKSSSELRRLVLTLAKEKIKDTSVRLKIESLIERCRVLTEERNDVVHGMIAKDIDGEPEMLTRDHRSKPLPTVKQRDDLEKELKSLAAEMNTARLEGFIHEALEAQSKKKAAAS